MATRKNPLRLNNLQLKTLAVLQKAAEGAPRDEGGSVTIGGLPSAHGDHFHVGNAVVLGRDMTGLFNPAVFAALERKGLVRSALPQAVQLTPEGLAYETGMESIFHYAHPH